TSLFMKSLENNIDIEYRFNGNQLGSRKILRNDLKVKNLLNIGNNYVSINKQKALIVAISTRSIDMVKFLLNCDININFEVNYGLTPLMLASMENSFDNEISSSNKLNHKIIVRDKHGFSPMIDVLDKLSIDGVKLANNHPYKFQFFITYESRYE